MSSLRIGMLSSDEDTDSRIGHIALIGHSKVDFEQISVFEDVSVRNSVDHAVVDGEAEVCRIAVITFK